jgi:hypothetical protein
VRRDPGRRRARFFDSQVTDLVTRDLQQISDIERPAEMRRLLSVVAARMGTLALLQSMANDIALPRQTLSRYLNLSRFDHNDHSYYVPIFQSKICLTYEMRLLSVFSSVAMVLEAE